MQNQSVTAIVVTYQPNLEVLSQLLNALVPQVTSVVIVNNSPHCDLAAWAKKRDMSAIELIQLGKNLGIAAAQNIGIQWARNRQAEFVLLMDQDSIPAPDMVLKLVSAISKQASPAAVGPRYLDERQDNPLSPFVRIRGLRLERCVCTSWDSIIPVDFLISSGSLIPMSVLDKIGNMREDLFIDYVDTEWIWRAQHHGLQSYGVYSAHMLHSLGDNPVNFLGENITLRGSLRHYYMFRNAILLYKEPWIPLNYKMVDGWRLVMKYILYSLLARPRLAHWKMMTLGMWHGMIGRAGELDGDSF